MFSVTDKNVQVKLPLVISLSGELYCGKYRRQVLKRKKNVLKRPCFCFCCTILDQSTAFQNLASTLPTTQRSH